MSIKYNLYDLVIHIQAIMKNNPYNFNEEDVIIKEVTQQIIDEIVQELEKLQEPLTSESEQSDYENVYAVNRCIETIKKMGEV